MQLSDRSTGMFTAALGGLAVYGGSLLPPVPGQQVGPSVFPMVVGTGLVLCGAMIGLGIGRRFEDEAEADLAAHENPPDPVAAQGGPYHGLRALIPPALLIFYVVAAERLGFILTAAIMVLVLAKSLGASWRLAISMALAAPPLVHLAFYKLLRVPLPPGLLTMPW